MRTSVRLEPERPVAHSLKSMQTLADPVDVDVIESPQITEEQRRADHSEEVLAAIEQNLLKLQSAFTQLDVCRNTEAELADEVRKAEAEETRILKDEEVSVPAATKKLVEARAKKDVLVARHTAARQRTTIQVEDVLEFGRIVRRNCVHLGAALLQARRIRLLEVLNSLFGAQLDSGLPVTNIDMVQACKPYRELQSFYNSVHMQGHKDVNEELAELKTAPDRWFAKLKSFIGAEPGLDLSSVFLGEG